MTPVNIAVFCRDGEKTSVSIAWMLSASLQAHHDWEEAEPIDNLCRAFWSRATCAGKHCKECDLKDELHIDILEEIKRFMAEEE